MNYPSLVSLREVAPRDGWQKFKTVLPTEVKRELICSMIDYGARELEIGVFSSDPVRGRQYLDLEPLCQAVLPYAAERGCSAPSSWVSPCWMESTPRPVSSPKAS